MIHLFLVMHNVYTEYDLNLVITSIFSLPVENNEGTDYLGQ